MTALSDDDLFAALTQVKVFTPMLAQALADHISTKAKERDALQARLAETERDKEHLQRAVDRACQVMREDVLTQDLDGTTTARVNLFLATYGTPVSATPRESAP